MALISNKANISKLSELKGKRLCHPGNDPFSANYDWSEVFSLVIVSCNSVYIFLSQLDPKVNVSKIFSLTVLLKKAIPVYQKNFVLTFLDKKYIRTKQNATLHIFPNIQNPISHQSCIVVKLKKQKILPRFFSQLQEYPTT